MAAAEPQNGAQRPLDLRTLFDAGVHFGHPSKRWNPKMEKFIFAKRARSHIFDLAKTVEAIENVKDYLRTASAGGARVLMVGTKKQAQEAVRENALRCGAWYINQRWLGGMLTNFQTIQKRIERLIYLEDALAKGTVETQTKRESLQLAAEVIRLNKFFGGIKEMDRLPDILFIVDTEKEDIAVKEARRLKIPIVAIVDTNSDPGDADFIIPGNDDAVRSVGLLAAHVADAILEGKDQFRAHQAERMAADAELEAQEAAARAAAQALAAERAAVVAAERQRKQAEQEGAAKAAASASSEAPAVSTEPKAEEASATASKTESVAVAAPEAAPEPASETPAKAVAKAVEPEADEKPKAAKKSAAKPAAPAARASAKPAAKTETAKPKASAAKTEEKVPEPEAVAEVEASEKTDDKKEEQSVEEKPE